MPGIFFKYDFSPVCVTIVEHSIPLGRFLVRICGIIGGVFATSCIVNGLINTFKSLFSGLFRNTDDKKGASNANSKQSHGQNGLKGDPQNPLLSGNFELKS